MAEQNSSNGQRGSTTIADIVVAKTAGITARQVPGVHDLGSGPARRIGAVKERFTSGDGPSGPTRGVSVEVGEKQTAIDLVVEVDYGERVHKVADEVRQEVISAVEGITGLEVVDVNITVDDVYMEGEESEQESEKEPALR
ncbi:Asp23/Gls24 family envelope stress response protein [Streptomyces sodiiphilus]|uniref:Asp23/Gls24 family envelope stress response protein n=1 Tax=Streptomyces sodiiphilus TaxID=226217 RepID=A0ABN2P460_9ACTN